MGIWQSSEQYSNTATLPLPTSLPIDFARTSPAFGLRCAKDARWRPDRRPPKRKRGRTTVDARSVSITLVLVGLHAATERRRDLEVCRSRHDIFKPPVKKLASTLTPRKESVPLEDGIEDLA